MDDNLSDMDDLFESLLIWKHRGITLANLNIYVQSWFNIFNDPFPLSYLLPHMSTKYGTYNYPYGHSKSWRIGLSYELINIILLSIFDQGSLIGHTGVHIREE